MNFLLLTFQLKFRKQVEGGGLPTPMRNGCEVYVRMNLHFIEGRANTTDWQRLPFE